MIRYTMTIDLPDEGTDPGDWPFVSAALDEIEPGASTHTLGCTPTAEHDGVSTYTHQRLGVTIAIDRQEV